MKSLLMPALLLAAAPALADPAPAPARCPLAAEQLSDDLASARQRIGLAGEVQAEFEVDADGRTRVVALQGTRRYRTPVRTALHTLDCRPGTPQRYALHIRFVDPQPRTVAVAASATLAQVQPRDTPAP